MGRLGAKFFEKSAAVPFLAALGESERSRVRPVERQPVDGVAKRQDEPLTVLEESGGLVQAAPCNEKSLTAFRACRDDFAAACR